MRPEPHPAIPLPIETERLRIRAFEPARDAEEMAAVYCDPEVMRFIPGGALRDRDAVREVLETHARNQRQRGFAFWAIVERRTRRVIGDVGFDCFETTGEPELGYTLGRASWGAGYATEAAAACLRIAFASLAVERVVCVVDVRNTASLRVAERIGMSKVGTVEAHSRPHALFEARSAADS